MSRVTIQIVTWNSLKFLRGCLFSIFNQTYKDFSVMVIDNASNDGTLEFLQKNYPEIRIIRNRRNLGFAAAHNQGIKLITLNKNKKTLTDNFVLILNPDIILAPDFLEKTILILGKNKKIASLSGKILKIYTSDPEIDEKVKTNVIDSTGFKIFKSGRVIDRGEGEQDKGQYDKEEKVFGLSAACVFYRLSALEDIKIPYQNRVHLRSSRRTSADTQFSSQIKDLDKMGEYFDEDFFTYKEDVDLAYRLNWRGWENLYFPEAIAYHYRLIFGGKDKIVTIVRRRRGRSPLLKYLSYRNHLMVMVKNESLSNFVRDFPWILFYELKKFIFLLFLEQKTIGAIFNLLFKIPKMIKKRSFIIRNRKIKPDEIRKWFN